jgi:septation ring formation regulator EzrA
MSTIYNLLSILNFIVTIAFLLGGVFAFRYGFTRTANEVQERVITALNSEIASLQDELMSLRDRQYEFEQTNAHLKMILCAIVNAMKRRRIYIDISQDFLTIHDERSGSTDTVSITHAQKQRCDEQGNNNGEAR